MLRLEIHARGRQVTVPFRPDSIFRVGSGESCEIKLPAELSPAVLLTVQARDGRVVAYNHGAPTATLGGHEFPLETPFDWRQGETLQAFPDVTMILRRGRTRSPRRRLSPASSSAAETGQSLFGLSSDVVPVCVTLACVAALGMIFVGPADNKIEVHNVLKAVILSAQEGNGSSGSTARALCFDLQEARAAQLRNDPTHARAMLLRVRDVLLHRRRPDGTFLSDWEARAFAVVCMMLKS